MVGVPGRLPAPLSFNPLPLQLSHTHVLPASGRGLKVCGACNNSSLLWKAAKPRVVWPAWAPLHVEPSQALTRLTTLLFVLALRTVLLEITQLFWGHTQFTTGEMSWLTGSLGQLSRSLGIEG